MSLESSQYRLADRLGQLFYPTAIVAAIAILVAVQFTFGTEVAVFGAYAVVGLGAGAAIHYGTDDVTERVDLEIDDERYRVAVYMTSAVTVGVVALAQEPLFILIGLIVGYALVVQQLFAEVTPERLIPQITVLFLLSPITKYLISGWYIGHGDLLFHMGLVESLMAGGSVDAISYSSYQQFPGLQLIAASFGWLSGLSAYDSLMITGLIAYTVLIPAVYLIAARITDHPTLALYTAFAVSLLDDISFYASYIFPQSVATILIIILALLVTLRSRDRITWQVAIPFIIVTLALSLTHHLTQILFAPVLGVALLLYGLRGRDYAVATFTSRKMGLVVFAAVVTTVRLFQTGFVDRLVDNALRLIQGGSRGGYTQGVTLSLGREPRISTVASSLDWLTSAYGVYIVLLLMIFSVAVAAFLHASERPLAQTALFGTGILGALLIFPTPIAIKSLGRIRSPWLFVFAFVIGIGLVKLRRRIGTTRQRRLLLAVFVVLAATGPLVTVDNYYGLDPRPSVQTSFSESETAELEALSGHIKEQSEPTTMLWLGQSVVERRGSIGIQTPQRTGEKVTLPEGQFVYRSAWADHKVKFRTGDRLYSDTLYISDHWLNERVAAGNKVYSAGSVGITWRSRERPIEEL